MKHIWPIREEEKEEDKFEEPTIDWWQKMKAKQAIIDKQIKAEMNGRIAN